MHVYMLLTTLVFTNVTGINIHGKGNTCITKSTIIYPVHSKSIIIPLNIMKYKYYESYRHMCIGYMV